MTLPEGYITMPIVRDKWACYTVGESLNNSLKWFDQKKKKTFECCVQETKMSDYTLLKVQIY